MCTDRYQIAFSHYISPSFFTETGTDVRCAFCNIPKTNFTDIIHHLIEQHPNNKLTYLKKTICPTSGTLTVIENKFNCRPKDVTDSGKLIYPIEFKETIAISDESNSHQINTGNNRETDFIPIQPTNMVDTFTELLTKAEEEEWREDLEALITVMNNGKLKHDSIAIQLVFDIARFYNTTTTTTMRNNT